MDSVDYNHHQLLASASSLTSAGQWHLVASEEWTERGDHQEHLGEVEEHHKGMHTPDGMAERRKVKCKDSDETKAAVVAVVVDEPLMVVMKRMDLASLR